MNKEISIKKIKEDAEYIFNHGFACSESVIYSIKNNFDLDLSDDAIAMGSGFPWGLGRAYCICGALAGGTMCLGYFFGRREPGDPKINKCFDMAKELHDYFKDNNGATCCRILTKGMDRDAGEHKQQCTRFTGMVAEKVAQMVVRELDFVNIDES